MGSVSTYLVHKSPVPVAVIRRQKKKKRARHELVAAHPLSEGKIIRIQVQIRYKKPIFITNRS